MKQLVAVAVAAALSLAAAPAWSRTILFIGNSFTFGELRRQGLSAGHRHRPERPGRGPHHRRGPGALQEMTKEAGLDYQVSLETAPGRGLDYHWNEKMAVLDKAWDEVILQSYSTLDEAKPGDPGILIKYTQMWTDMLLARNPQARIYLTPPGAAPTSPTSPASHGPASRSNRWAATSRRVTRRPTRPRPRPPASSRSAPPSTAPSPPDSPIPTLRRHRRQPGQSVVVRQLPRLLVRLLPRGADDLRQGDGQGSAVAGTA